MEVNEKIAEIIDSLKDMEEIIGIAAFSKFGNMIHGSLPDWINPHTLIKMIDSLLKVSNQTLRELRQGQTVRTMIESDKGNILISSIGNDIIIFITKKDVQIKLFDNAKMNKILEFKL